MEKDAMFKLGYGLYVVTARDEKDNGCIINTVMQLTDTPNRIAMGVNKLNFTHDMILKTGEFNVSILAQGVTFDAFEHFGFQSGKTVDKFAGYEFARRADNGIYYITKNTNAYLSAKVTQTVDCGTHALFIADVMDAKVLSNAVSVTYDDYYKNIKPKPEETKVKGWRCKICNYVYEGEELPPDYICPLCKHGAEDFEKIE